MIQFVRLFRLVSNIPYGGVGGRDVDELLLNNAGSCSSKHQLLAELAIASGYEIRFCMGVSDLRSLNTYLPESLKVDTPLLDYHNFLQVNLEGKWRIVDATFGVREFRRGLPSNIHWNGRGDCNLLFPIEGDWWNIDDIFSEKRKYVDNLDPVMNTKRKEFFSNFSQYLQCKE